MYCQQTENLTIDIPHNIDIKATEGGPLSQHELVKSYFNAILAENNDSLAFEWILCFAEQNNMEAQFRLGDLYALGCGTAKSFPDAYKWYTKAAHQGYKKALIRIHNLYQGDIRIHCRGQLNSEEEEWASDYYKKKNNIRELYEYRLKQNKSILNGAINYYTRQFDHYKSSNHGDQNVQLNLAFLYQHGYGVKKCVRWAFEYYELAANQGNIDAQYHLGYLYQKHTDKKFNYRHAFKWYTKSAQGGNIAAQRCLAYFYLKGLATSIDYDTAIFWYTKAANASDSEAQVILGKLYRKGDYVKQDLSIAVKWYSLAARQGSRVAQNCLSQLHQRGMLSSIELKDDITEYTTKESMNERLCSKLATDISKLGNSPKIKQLNKLAKCACIGDGPAMYEIGLYYYNGENSFSQDKDTGKKWIKKAANAKHKDAQFMLADVYKKGNLIEQDYRKAYIWYKELSKKKDSQAQCNVGITYDKGLGVRVDPLEASKWFTWAADQGNSDAQYKLGALRYYGRGLSQDMEEAIEWFNKAINQRNIQTCFKIGKFYINNRWDEKYAQALKLLRFAANHGNVDAQQYLGQCYKDGRGIQQDKQKSLEYYTLAAESGDAYSLCELALAYLDEDVVKRDYIKAYNILMQAIGEESEDAKQMFQNPLASYSYIENFSKIVDMFIEVTEKGIDNLEFQIGNIYEHGKIYFGRVLFNKNYTSAIKWYLAASKKGDSRADYRLGIMYEYGTGVERNIETAIYYYNQAVIKENRNAMYRLASIYLKGREVAQDLIKAFQLYTRASNMGHQKATEALMVSPKNNGIRPGYEDDVECYFDDHLEIPVNRRNQIKMLEEATMKGYTRLQYQLGVMYEDNNNKSKAFKWLSLAADLGITDACYRVGVFYEEGRGAKQNCSMAASMYQKAVEKDHEDAYYRLGQLYQYGKGAKQDYLKAYNCYKKAADLGHAIATKVLNITLETKTQFNGDKNENDYFSISSKEYNKSLLMHKVAAKHGDTEAQFKIGFAYEYNYAKPNYVEAFKWYSMAVRGSHREAMYHLGLLYEYGFGVSQDYHETVQLYEQAYKLGSVDALFRLAIAHHYGRGVDMNLEKAIEYYTLAAELGDPKYQCELGRLYEKGEIVQKNLLEALKWYTIAYTQGYDIIGPELRAMYESKPYEHFFWKKLLHNLLNASCNQSGLSIKDHKSYDATNNRIGSLYFFGQGTTKDLKKAWEYFSKGYLNFQTSTIEHFRFLQYDLFSSSQKKDVLAKFEEAGILIEHSSANVLYSIGMIYFDGAVYSENINNDIFEREYTPIDDQDLGDPSQYIVIEKDYYKAFRYLKKAAEKKHPQASIQLGIMHCCGYGTDRDCNEGDRYFNSISSDHIDLIQDIATFYHTHKQMQNFSKAVEYYRRLEKSLNENSDIGSYERKHINQQVQSGFGLLYEYGDGVEQDYQKALECYKKLADDGDGIGLHRLGLMYYYGKGTFVDYRKSFDLFQKVIHKGSWSTKKIAYVYSSNGLHENSSQNNLVYCVKSEYQMIGESEYYLGLMYKNGQGVFKDEDIAQSYFKSALEYGCERAKNEIKD